ncbi:proton-associated sugar transporter A-like [Anopheles ziemanni]|uniref:proton-associated sugar transporter A-like n=1 Tax=Anopheles coustani TaxID=139045 RepID=UPI0026590361|nr:proton-associated sugar transporter A-like [Anopheles coustani]XP_058173528.1 proton-associated sugar transporter A-like [Anopheles ziemanni]
MLREIKRFYNWLASAVVSSTVALVASRPNRKCERNFGRPKRFTDDDDHDEDSDADDDVIPMVKTGKDCDPYPTASGCDAVAWELRRAREEHARHQRHDYSHVFRKKSLLDLIRLSFVSMGIEIMYSAETAFVTPILLGIGIEHQLMTVVWGISPLIGFIVSPFLGTFSDRCRSRFGRRRPVLMMLGIGLVLGCLLLPFGETIGHWLGDIGEAEVPVFSNSVVINSASEIESTPPSTTPSIHYRWTIVFTILGTILLDFCADSTQPPAMAYLLDVSLPEDHERACSMFSLLSGVGGCIGYLIGAIDWDGTMLGQLLGGNINTVFILVMMIFVLSVTVTVCSFREIPLALMERDELLQPLTERIIAKERQHITSEEKLFAPRKDLADSLLPLLDNEHELNDNHVTLTGYTEKESLMGNERTSRTAKNFFNIASRIPPALGVLCATNLFCWMSHISYSIYFTDFVGEKVFGGDPMANSDSNEYALYLQGVRYGCFGLAICAIASSTYSCVIERLIRRFRARTVYCGGLLIDSLGMLIMALFPNKVTVYVFSATGGIVSSFLYTMPYIILAKYHAKGWLDASGDTNSTQPRRGLAADISLIGSMLFVAQIILSLSMGPLVTLTGTTASVIYTASVCNFMAALCASQIQYLDL